ncbi:uncharacterized protein LOC119101171 [Pollicipes pollicipes]|uniref:uncharacterized protein LOC119101171 n=1 Tax=Pollicipes pollicipes TaxID=41117 RepID=UPI00188558E9|nr:uncharacterized protein LOC119101171 [Pollicipes pollicipes]
MNSLLALTALVAAAHASQPMAKNIDFHLLGRVTETFETTRDKLRDDEVLKVQMHPMGRKDARPTAETPVWFWVSDGSSRHSWELPWRPGGGPALQWLEVLLCQNQDSVQLEAETNSTHALPLRWRVSTENVKLGDGGTMKSTPADVSYRRHLWDPASGALEVELNVATVTGDDVCASLAVTRRCVTHPYELTDDYLLQRVRFSQRAQLTVSRDDAPDGFWLYLIPEVDSSLCPMTAGRRPTGPLPAKTVRVYRESRAFRSPSAPEPLADWGALPIGRDVGGIGADGDWADPLPPGTCGERVSHLERQLQAERQQCHN